ncbi:MAG: phosphate acyltransferase PlsX [Burkholderiales bacterium]|uniref:phosphate acyltransferase PlsX n=1 Tax=Inhella sp. TaxID=1921806 RepID=UPI001AD3B753|nr:phosphate acyltransferase PlsX [Burkholderiales bacterium]
MKTTVRIAVDVMGGDHGANATLPACRAFLTRHEQAELLLVGQAEILAKAADWPRTRCVEAAEVVEMHDPIEVALRKKRHSSMRLAIEQLRGDSPAADACVSSGNTGALMALAKVLLKTVDGIDRPAIAASMPNAKGGATTVLDLGANVDCGPEHLLQFAVMGSALVTSVTENESPSVGLLNVGEEVIKGSEVIKRAGELLRAADAAGQIRFLGNVEGNDIFKGTADVVVCDGFVGNVALKSAEGLASMVSAMLRQEFSGSLLARASGVLALPVLKRFKARVDHRKYNGAALLGLRGLVFKSHGSADALAFERALERAYEAARHDLLERVHERVAATLQSA